MPIRYEYKWCGENWKRCEIQPNYGLYHYFPYEMNKYTSPKLQVRFFKLKKFASGVASTVNFGLYSVYLTDHIKVYNLKTYPCLFKNWTDPARFDFKEKNEDEIELYSKN